MTNLFGRLMIDIDGFNLTNEDKSILSSKHIGGLILFSRNFDSYDQLYNLIKEVHSIKENIIIAVDQEGGRVQRFEKEFTKIPSMQEVSLFAKENADQDFIKDLVNPLKINHENDQLCAFHQIVERQMPNGVNFGRNRKIALLAQKSLCEPEITF